MSPFWRQVVFAACWSMWGSLITLVTIEVYHHWTAPQPAHCWVMSNEGKHTVIHCENRESPVGFAIAARGEHEV